jgi:diaminopimelate epimerase
MSITQDLHSASKLLIDFAKSDKENVLRVEFEIDGYEFQAFHSEIHLGNPHIVIICNYEFDDNRRLHLRKFIKSNLRYFNMRVVLHNFLLEIKDFIRKEQ